MAEIVPLVDEGLGNSAYLVGLGDGQALVIDPARDPRRYLAEAERRGWRITHSAETHLHADFVSGSRELAVLGAEILAPAAAQLAFRTRDLHDGDEVSLGGLTLRALATPGHTPEHLAYVLLDAGRPVAVFTGGTLIVGGVARPDLIGPEQTEPLARAAHRSIRGRLLVLPDELGVYPTHGAGSFCAAGGSGERTTTIGAERRTNPLLVAGDEDAFVERLLGRLGSHPPYFLQLRDVNRAGPAVLGIRPPGLARLSVPQLHQALAEGAELVDVRPVAAYAEGHLPGALSNPLRPQFATWLGWLVGIHRPLVFVCGPGTDRDLLTSECRKIGAERLVGELDGGVEAWRAAGRPVERIPLVMPNDAISSQHVLDVRQSAEWAAGHIPGVVHVELGRLRASIAELPRGQLLVHCGHGERAMTAASLLARAGRCVHVLAGGPGEWSKITGLALEVA